MNKAIRIYLPYIKCEILSVFLPLCFLIIVFSFQPAHAAQPDYLTHENPVPHSVNEIEGPLTSGLSVDKQESGRIISSFLKNQIADLPPFGKDSSAKFNLRSYYLERNSGDTTKKAWALGGGFFYKSGFWENLLQVGATVYTSQRLYGPKEHDGTLLLRTNQQELTVLGEAFVTVNLFDHAKLNLYRQSFDLPYVNKQDSRMVPNTFEAYTLFNKDNPHFNYIVSHLTDMKTRNSPNFVSMSEAAGFAGTDEDATLFGARYTVSEKFNIGALNIYSWEFMNIFYSELNSVWDLTDDLAIRVSGQYTDQESVGDEIGGEFSTYVFGLKVSASYQGTVLNFAYTSTDENSGIRTPYGGYAGYISLIEKDFNRADEDAWLVGVSTDFKNFGLKGLSGFINYAEGSTPDSGLAASPDQQELDITIDYRFNKTWLEGLWLRARAAFIDQDGDSGNYIEQYRMILNYELPVL